MAINYGPDAYEKGTVKNCRFAKQNVCVASAVTARQNGNGGHFAQVKVFADAKSSVGDWSGRTRMLTLLSKDEAACFDKAWREVIYPAIKASKNFPKRTPSRKGKKEKAAAGDDVSM